jgi:N-methylhydantoinase A
MRYRITCDVGGTFTDAVVADDDGNLYLGKALTTPEHLYRGLESAVAVAASETGFDPRALLQSTDLFVYSTTQATNAILEGRTARTALLVTDGFPDVLVRREGGRLDPFNFAKENPEPYVPRRLTFEIHERIDSEGLVYTPLDVDRVHRVLEVIRGLDVEAIAVSLLWSIVNPVHELAVGKLIEEDLPGIPYTLSHLINPIIREYRRTSSAAIDASLKPLMQHHLREIEEGLTKAGLAGELVAATSFGGVMHMDDLMRRPIYAVKSGPSLAPIAGKTYAESEAGPGQVIVCDTGGTSFDVSLVRDGRVVFTRETWLGEQFTGHLTGLSSVDARSIGAGGGSIAWIDSGGLLRVGPRSAGAEPGPASYGRGGKLCTVTDAAVVLGYLDPNYFLGGRMKLDSAAARRVVGEIAHALDRPMLATAYGILSVANELMVGAIKEITVDEGVDPRESLLVAGGGAAGMNIIPIARELGCSQVLIPRTASALSACGAQYSDIVAEFSASKFTDTNDFDYPGVNLVLRELDSRMEEFADGLHQRRFNDFRREYFVEARYANQAWELELSMRRDQVGGPNDVAVLVDDFHKSHQRVFAITDPGQTVECVNWKGRLTAVLDKPPLRKRSVSTNGGPHRSRSAYFPATGEQTIEVYMGATLPPGSVVKGPAVIEEPTTTIVVYPNSSVRVTDFGNYLVEVEK